MRACSVAQNNQNISYLPRSPCHQPVEMWSATEQTRFGPTRFSQPETSTEATNNYGPHTCVSIGPMPDRSKPRKPKPLSPSALARMTARRPAAKFAVAATLILLALYIFSPSPSAIDSLLLLPIPTAGGQNQNPKIYVYDLPKKFTHGVIRSYLAARSTPPASDSDLKYPGHQHSAEWHLLSDLLRPSRPGSPLTRTLDPTEADLFYVPFFSSLSLVVNPIRPAGTAPPAVLPAYSDEAMQEELMDWLEGQEYWKRNGGRDHVFICQDPNALYRVVDRIRNSVLLVSDFGRLKPDQASLVKDVILPYSHRINTYKGDIGVEGRDSLLFFRGNRYRKEGGKVRDTLFQILENEKDVVIKHGAQSRESRRMATQGMHSSKFCLHPAGDTPSACRLFDATVSLCIPVIVSDRIELPFEDVIDYRKIAIFVDTDAAVEPRYLTSMLRGISTDKILQYQRELHAVKHYFEYEDPNGTVNEIWRQVAAKVPLIKLMTNRDKRLVKSDLVDPDCSCVCSTQNRTVGQSLPGNG